MSGPKVHIDFETYSEVDLAKAGVHVYAAHPSTKILCLAFAFDEEEEVHLWRPQDGYTGAIARLIVHVRRGDQVWAHNAPFEFHLWNACLAGKMIYGPPGEHALLASFPHLFIEQLYCTATMAGMMGLPLGLGPLALALGLEDNKDKAGNALMKKLCKPDRHGLQPPWDDRLGTYCQQDVRVERSAARRLFPLPPEERATWLLDQKINNLGVRVDLPLVLKALDIVESVKLGLDEQMYQVTGGAVEKASQVEKLRAWIEDSFGIEVGNLRKATVKKLLSREDICEEVKTALTLRQRRSKASTAKLVAMSCGASSDSRLRGLFQYAGASTGRFAGRRAQPHNMPRKAPIDHVFELLEEIN